MTIDNDNDKNKDNICSDEIDDYDHGNNDDNENDDSGR